MENKNGVLYHILDQHTHEQVTYSPVTEYADGTPMDDSKCDGVIYRKLGTGVSATYHKRVIPDGLIKVAWFGIVGDDTDESEKVQAMFNALSGQVAIKWDERTYRFAGVTIPQKITNLLMQFENTVFKLPWRDANTTPTQWSRYFTDAVGEHMLLFDNIRKVFLTGVLEINGERREGMGYDTDVLSYNGQGLQPVFRVTADAVSLPEGGTPYTKTVSNATYWTITETGFTVNQTGAGLTSGTINFTRKTGVAYRAKVKLTIRSGQVGWIHLGWVNNYQTQSGTYTYDILKDEGSNYLSFVTDDGADADIEILSFSEVPVGFTDTYFKTSGSFTMKNHGFSSLGIYTFTTTPSYRVVELNDWNFIDTPIGGHNVSGWFYYVQYQNYKLDDRTAQTHAPWSSDEGARSFGIGGMNSQDPDSFPDYVVIKDIFADYSLVPSASSAKNIRFENIYIRNFGKFIGDDGIERNISEDDGTQYALPLHPGGEPAKLDFPYPYFGGKVEIINYNTEKTSLYVQGNSRTWKSFWFQSGVKNGLISHCTFDSHVVAGGIGDYDDTAQTWAQGATLSHCIFTETGFLSVAALGVKMVNCKFTRNAITKTVGGKHDFPFPDYTDLASAGFLGGTHPDIVDTGIYGAGERFEPTQWVNCVFVAREWFPQVIDANNEFVNCTFKEGTRMPCSGSASGYNFRLKLKNSKRLILYPYDAPSSGWKSKNIVRLEDSEIIISGYTGVADLENSASTIRNILDTTTFSWSNLKVYDTAGNLLHDLKGFEWFREPATTTSYGIEGATYRTTNKVYLYKNGAWVITAAPSVATSPTPIGGMWLGTQAQYDAIITKDTDTLYFIS
jgi:hypothetical protein